MEVERIITVRRLGAADVNIARSAVLDVHNRPLPDEGSIVRFLADESRYMLVALSGEQVIGSLSGHALRSPERADPHFLLFEIDVLPDYRSQGVGGLLVDKFVEEARLAKAFEVWVLTNKSNLAAMALYEGRGFRIQSRDDQMLVFDLSTEPPSG